MHIEECKILQSKSNADGSFDDYDLITPLRVLILRKSHPKLYKSILELEANLDAKVNENY